MLNLYFCLPSGVFYNFATYYIKPRELLFLVPLLVKNILFIFLCAIPFLLSKKFDLQLYVPVYMNACFANCVSFGNYFMGSFYAYPQTPAFCGMSTIPDNILAAFVAYFCLEYYKAKNPEQNEDEDAKVVVDDDKPKKKKNMYLFVVFQVIKNPLLIAGVFGINNILVFYLIYRIIV
jgi:predicted permease